MLAHTLPGVAGRFDVRQATFAAKTADTQAVSTQATRRKGCRGCSSILIISGGPDVRGIRTVSCVRGQCARCGRRGNASGRHLLLEAPEVVLASTDVNNIQSADWDRKQICQSLPWRK